MPALTTLKLMLPLSAYAADTKAAPAKASNAIRLLHEGRTRCTCVFAPKDV